MGLGHLCLLNGEYGSEGPTLPQILRDRALSLMIIFQRDDSQVLEEDISGL